MAILLVLVEPVCHLYIERANRFNLVLKAPVQLSLYRENKPVLLKLIEWP